MKKFQSSISVDLPLKFALCVAIFFRAVCFKREKFLCDPLYFLHFQNYTCISLPSYMNLLKFIPTLNCLTVENCHYTKVRKIHVCEIIVRNSLLQITVFFHLIWDKKERPRNYLDVVLFFFLFISQVFSVRCKTLALSFMAKAAAEPLTYFSIDLAWFCI